MKLCTQFALTVFGCGLELINFAHIFRIISLVLGQSYQCPSVGEATPKDMEELI